MKLKKMEIPTSKREMNVQEGDGVKKRESPSKRWRLDMYVLKLTTDKQTERTKK